MKVLTSGMSATAKQNVARPKCGRCHTEDSTCVAIPKPADREKHKIIRACNGCARDLQDRYQYSIVKAVPTPKTE